MWTPGLGSPFHDHSQFIKCDEAVVFMPDSTESTRSSENPLRQEPGEPASSAASPGSSTLAERLQFLGFGEADRELLRGLQQPFANIADDFFRDFYRLLTANPHVASLLHDSATVDRLMGLQRIYFTQLLSGPFDNTYGESRFKIGATHQRIGLEPAWYLGAYCLYTQLCFPRFAAELGATCPPALLSLLKIIFADVSLVLDTYFATATRQLRERNEELETALKMYFQAEMQLQHHARLASHEIRGTLNALANACDELCDDLAADVPTEVASIHGQMRGKLWQLCGVVDEILHSSTQAGQPVAVPLDSLLSEIQRRTSLYGGGKSLSLVTPDLTEAVLWGDPVALREAVANLVANAFRHHHRDVGTIEITYAQRTSGHEIQVIDDGPGIPESVQDRIFEPFVRGADARRSGRGLGLYFVKRIVEDHGGHISMSSQPGAGTRFTILLPLKPRDAVPAEVDPIQEM
jgi:signal transduction histidine kinase